jgi:hypothetical protein
MPLLGCESGVRWLDYLFGAHFFEVVAVGRSGRCLPMGSPGGAGSYKLFIADRLRRIYTRGGEAVGIHDGVDLKTPTGIAWRQKGIPRGPILLQGDHGPVAFRKIRVRAIEP